MKYALATSYDNYEHDLTHWAIVFHGYDEYTAYPFETVGQMHASIIGGELETMTDDTDGFGALLESHKAGANTFPNDNVMDNPNHPDPFPYLIHHETKEQ